MELQCWRNKSASNPFPVEKAQAPLEILQCGFRVLGLSRNRW
jgi:hypothetical protein